MKSFASQREKCGETLPRKYSFRWLGRSHPVVEQNVVEHIVERVFVDEEHIYPCVDLGVADLLEDGSLLIVGNVAGIWPAAIWPQLDGTRRTVRSCGGNAPVEQDGRKTIQLDT